MNQQIIKQQNGSLDYQGNNSPLEINATIETILEPQNNSSIPVALVENVTDTNTTLNTIPVLIQGSTKYIYSSNSETICNNGICTTTLYSESRFVYENNTWKPIEEARSLMGVWEISINEDPNYPVKVVDYNYTTIILNLSASQINLQRDIPLLVYNKYNSTQLPKNADGNEIRKDKSIRINKIDEEQTVVIDLSDTIENLLTQEIKWGDSSTIITVYDNNSVNIGDTHINEEAPSINYGSDSFMYIENFSGSTRDILISFDISQIPRQAMVDNARLYLYLDSNSLDAGETYNVSVHSIYASYQWSENTVKWSTGPQSGTDYNASYLDKIRINNTDTAKYILWNVTDVIKRKNRNESFYIRAIENLGGDSTGDDIRFRTKEHPSTLKPYLNVTYRLKNLVSTTVGETPFYTANVNPYYIDLEQNVCRNITWAVNATGSIGTYIFFGYANKTANNSIGTYTNLVDVNII